jgi:hypothetical protein
MLRALRWALGSALVVGVLFTAMVGFAHTKPGRPLLAVIGPAMGMKPASCPLGYDVQATPSEREAVMRAFSSTHRGARSAPSRPALGFVLERTTRDDVAQWATTYSVVCRKPEVGFDLECRDTSVAATGRVLDSLGFLFGAHGQLIGLRAMRKMTDVNTAVTSATELTQSIAQQAGPAFEVTGEVTPAFLSAGLLAQAASEFRFQNYFAVVRTTAMKDGFLVTQEYRALAPL